MEKQYATLMVSYCCGLCGFVEIKLALCGLLCENGITEAANTTQENEMSIDNQLLEQITLVLKRFEDIAIKPEGWTKKEHERSLEAAIVWSKDVCHKISEAQKDIVCT